MKTEDLDRLIGWVEKVIAKFGPYKPEVRTFTVNLRHCTSELSMALKIPDNLRRKFVDVQVPAYEGLVIDSVIDESFHEVTGVFALKDGHWVAKATDLPKSDTFLVRMRGAFPHHLASVLVWAEPARTRDRTETEQRYWLHSMIKSPEIFEKMYTSLNVDNVAVGARISLQRSFAATIPKEISNRIEATREWIAAAQTRDKNRLLQAKGKFMFAQRSTDVSLDDIIAAIHQITGAEVFARHVTVAAPYVLGEIERGKSLTNPFPEDMDVEARTRLTLREPVAQANLIFKYKAFEEELSRLFAEEPQK